MNDIDKHHNELVAVAESQWLGGGTPEDGHICEHRDARTVQHRLLQESIGRVAESFRTGTIPVGKKP